MSNSGYTLVASAASAGQMTKERCALHSTVPVCGDLFKASERPSDMLDHLHRTGFYPLILAASFAATSTFAANPDQGETLAKRWCTGCHLVAADQKAATTEAPPFASVARRPGFDAAKIAFFLLDPHPKMPNMELSRDEAADIAAYISTLK
jgi:mono/diheme cytochrome c family protein